MILSDSSLWLMQKEAYSRLGVQSWAKERVPFQITNNSRIASQYAEIACSSAKGSPFTVLELGGGSGKFAFHFISELTRINIPFRYILTDAAEKNEAYWKNHPLLKSFIDRGILQTAVYDPLNSPPQKRGFSGTPCKADFVIANYFFDSIPQDLFRVENGQLFEGIVPQGGDMGFSSILDACSFRPLEKTPYLDLQGAAAVLEECRGRFEGKTFFFPIGAMRAIRHLDAPFFLAADRGVSNPRLSEHGSVFSLPVDFHAISRFNEKRGGETIFPCSSSDFIVALFSQKTAPAPVKLKCGEMVFGSLKTEANDLSEIRARLEEAHWDATLFFSYFDRVVEFFPKAPALEREKLQKGMMQIRDRFFPLFREEALLLHRLGLFFKSIGEEGHAALHSELSAAFNDLPPIESFSDTLIIGRSGLKNETGIFNSIVFFPSGRASSRNIPACVREIEERFSFLNEIVYSDADIEGFFAAAEDDSDPNHVLHFFAELERRKNISREQLERIGWRLELETSLLFEEDKLFETLQTCLKEHMKKGSVFRAFLSSGDVDGRIYDKIVVDPYLEYEEKEENGGMWIMVRKL